MENQEVRHITENGKYRVIFEKAASANKIDGFKVEVNDDNMEDAKLEAESLYNWASHVVEGNKPVQPVAVK